MLSKSHKSGLGFTLIEIMIVVFIIALLSTAAVGGYTRYRKISLLEIAADNIVSTIYQARDRASHGVASSLSQGSVCYEIYFDKNAETGKNLMKVSSDFDAKKKWDENSKNWTNGICEGINEQGESVDLDDLVVIEKISVNGGDIDKCSILFAPPDGKISTTCGSGEDLSILINYGEEADTSYQRIIKFDLKSGIANVKNPNEK